MFYDNSKESIAINQYIELVQCELFIAGFTYKPQIEIVNGIYDPTTNVIHNKDAEPLLKYI